MFICDECLEGFHNSGQILGGSVGRCEICGESKVCSDIPSKYLRKIGASYKFYIAGSWKSIDVVREIWRALDSMGHEYYDWSAHGYLTEEIGKEGPEFLRDPRVKGTFAADVQALEMTEAFVLVAPGGNSSHIEAGIAFRSEKRMVLIGEVARDCFYNVFDAFYPTVPEFLKGEC